MFDWPASVSTGLQCIFVKKGLEMLQKTISKLYGIFCLLWSVCFIRLFVCLFVSDFDFRLCMV